VAYTYNYVRTKLGMYMLTFQMQYNLYTQLCGMEMKMDEHNNYYVRSSYMHICIRARMQLLLNLF